MTAVLPTNMTQFKVPSCRLCRQMNPMHRCCSLYCRATPHKPQLSVGSAEEPHDQLSPPQACAVHTHLVLEPTCCARCFVSAAHICQLVSTFRSFVLLCAKAHEECRSCSTASVSVQHNLQAATTDALMCATQCFVAACVAVTHHTELNPPWCRC